MAFSHSSIKTYEQCPFKYKLTRIDKLQEPAGDAAERGKLVHTLFELALKEPKTPVPEFEYWYDYVQELATKNTRSEVSFAITRDWFPCQFLDSKAWIRGIFDAVYLDDNGAHVLDWKTGKERDYADQLKLYATILLTIYPNIKRVSMEICYVDGKKRQSYGIVTRDALPDLQAWVSEKVMKIENDDIYAPNPSYACRWCHFRKNNGGPCQW